VSAVITDTHASDAAVQLLEQHGVRVITAEPEALPDAATSASYGAVLDLSAMYAPEISH
jgi:DeoR family ulaG and ulaABCDEF operon transcriptional repressor